MHDTQMNDLKSFKSFRAEHKQAGKQCQVQGDRLQHVISNVHEMGIKDYVLAGWNGHMWIELPAQSSEHNNQREA